MKELSNRYTETKLILKDNNDNQDSIQEIYDESLQPLLDYCQNIMDFYAERRTKNKKGITIQSQIRFLRMYTLYLFNRFKLHSLRNKDYGGNEEDKENEDNRSNITAEIFKQNKLEYDIHNLAEGNEESKQDNNIFEFYKDVLSALENKSLDEIKPSRDLPLLMPLQKENNADDFKSSKIKVYKITCIGYKNPKSIRLEVVDREIKKTFDLIIASKPEKDRKKLK